MTYLIFHYVPICQSIGNLSMSFYSDSDIDTFFVHSLVSWGDPGHQRMNRKYVNLPNLLKNRECQKEVIPIELDCMHGRD